MNGLAPVVLVLPTALIAPALFWIAYLYYKDRYQPEPLLAVGLAYALGIVSGWLCLHTYDLLDRAGLPVEASSLAGAHRLVVLAYFIGIVGLVEELYKLLPLVLVLMHGRDFDERIDGMIYASCIALGFATFENIFYLPELGGLERWGRAVASPLTHTMFSSVWGYAVSSAKLDGRSVLPAAAVGLGLSAVLHGVYDFFTVVPYLRPAAALLILGIWVWRMRTIRRLHAESLPEGESPHAPERARGS